ncbi:hypothetical protein HDU93_002282 [Gonapodya sp. JEL0774]|nr:hypothetical protein HDU93_002282 [Gonapodya sp. JEL0774]
MSSTQHQSTLEADGFTTEERDELAAIVREARTDGEFKDDADDSLVETFPSGPLSTSSPANRRLTSIVNQENDDEPTSSLSAPTSRSLTPMPDPDGLSWPSIGTRARKEESHEERERRVERMTSAVKTILECIGEDPEREENILDVVNGAIFREDHDEMVIVKGIEVFSMCEHHCVPFMGKISIGYLPHQRVLGLSKVARIAEMFARRLQLQERLTKQVAVALESILKPRGVAVVMEASEEQARKVIMLFGPRGLREYIRNSLASSYCRLSTRVVINELWTEEDLAKKKQAGPSAVDEVEVRDEQDAQQYDGVDMAPRSDGTWLILEEKSLGLTVEAGKLQHSAPCVGFAVRELDSPGRLRVEEVRPHLDRNANALKASGVKNPLQLLAKIKNGEIVNLPDGIVLDPAQFLDPPKRGRHLVILGDTSDSSAIARIAEDCTVLVHEATNACLAEDRTNGMTTESVEQQTIDHGHSNPQMAGRFAKLIRARRLILTHFSHRYKGDTEPESLKIMEEIRQLAVEAFGSDEVLTARDLLSVEVHRSE